MGPTNNAIRCRSCDNRMTRIGHLLYFCTDYSCRGRYFRSSTGCGVLHHGDQTRPSRHIVGPKRYMNGCPSTGKKKQMRGVRSAA
jgi:hypothetical protein